METTSNEVRIQELGEDIESICEAFGDLPPYEVGYRLIASGVHMLLRLAPNEMVAMKTILASIEVGISEYQNNK